jgi:hypothetical protein
MKLKSRGEVYYAEAANNDGKNKRSTQGYDILYYHGNHSSTHMSKK